MTHLAGPGEAKGSDFLALNCSLLVLLPLTGSTAPVCGSGRAGGEGGEGCPEPHDRQVLLTWQEGVWAGRGDCNAGGKAADSLLNAVLIATLIGIISYRKPVDSEEARWVHSPQPPVEVVRVVVDKQLYK